MSTERYTISCIIPAYNEGPRIRNVLSLVSSHHLIDEIIVVDDGSIDGTHAIVSAFPKVQSIRHSKNRGKSAAIASGLLHATGSIICFLDADLVGLHYENITDLITPVMQNTVGMAISMRKSSPWIDRKLGIDYISGERVFHRTLLENHLQEIQRLPHFGLEVFINKIVIQTKTSLKIVFWEEVVSPPPFKKRGLVKGTKSFVGMLGDIFQVISVFGVVSQFIQMRRLRLKKVSAA